MYVIKETEICLETKKEINLKFELLYFRIALKH